MRPAAVLAAALGLLLGAGCGAVGPEAEAPRRNAAETPPGLDFVPPAPGTYELPVIQEAVDGEVIDADGSARRLFDYMDGKVVLISFIYLNCSDARGCPLATANMFLIRQDVESDPNLAASVRLISLSFDPERDTPEAMLRHGGSRYLETPWEDRQWALLTTSSRAELEPILDGYGQSLVREVDEEGRETGDFSHVLKLFLVDRHHRVRNIYSSSYLHPAIAVNDLKTLLIDEARG